MRVLIRADGNREIAMGHMMRCLSVAEALRDRGSEALFVTAGRETAKLIASRGFSHRALETDFSRMEEELPVLRRVVGDYGPDWILTDSYFVTAAYMAALQKWALTAYMDDMGLPVYPADMLINYNIYGESLPYEDWYAKEGLAAPKELLLGCRYAPLRKEFAQRPGQGGKRAQGFCKNVLISTGGGDRAGIAARLCGRLSREMERGLHRGIQYHVVCGPFSEEKERLRELARRRDAFVIHENVTRMGELMEACDIAVSAAGSTMYELCSKGLPIICFYFAENQRQMAECFGKTTGIVNAGNILTEKEAVFSRILERLGELEKDASLREKIGRQAGSLVDGRGAARIAKRMTERDEKKGSEF